MIVISDGARTKLHIVGALIWAYLVVVSAVGPTAPLLSYSGLLAGAVLGGIYFVLGTTTGDRIGSWAPLAYPIAALVLLWCVAFTIAYATRGERTDLVLGMHTGMLSSLLLFWIGAMLTSTLGYHLHFDRHILPEESWTRFMAEVARLKSDSEEQP